MITIALVAALVIVLMQLLGCMYPPAGAHPLLILLNGFSVYYAWRFLIFPVFTGVVLLVMIARLM